MWNPLATRPPSTETDVTCIVQRIYGLHVTACRQLTSYDDKNYHVLVAAESSNPFVPEPLKSGYVFKILNTHDSAKRKLYFEAQINMMLHVRRKGLMCPEPVRTTEGHFYAAETFAADSGESTICLVRLTGFIEGDVMADVPITKALMYEAGVYLGRMQECLKDFECLHLERVGYQWSFSYIAQLKKLLPYLQDSTERQLADEVIESWIAINDTTRQRLRTGPIHGDLNEQNIIVRKELDGTHHVYCVLDFGDASFDCYVYDLSILIMYMMTFGREDMVDAGGYVISGYLSEQTLNDEEELVLYKGVAARLAQSLLIGAYSYSATADEFQLQTQKPGWCALKALWGAGRQDVWDRWRATASAYRP